VCASDFHWRPIASVLSLRVGGWQGDISSKTTTSGPQGAVVMCMVAEIIVACLVVESYHMWCFRGALMLDLQQEEKQWRDFATRTVLGAMSRPAPMPR